MRIIKSTFAILLMLVILWNITIFAASQTDNITACHSKKGYKLYKCEFDNICKKEDYWTTTNKIVNIKNQYNETITFKKAKEIYRHNQNNIYICWVLSAQEKAYSELVVKLTGLTDKTGILTTKIVPKIKLKLEKINTIKDQNWCETLKYGGKTKKAVKKIILDQSTFELCNYRYYLKYLDNTAENNLKDSFPEWKESISSKDISDIINEKQTEIKNEIQHSMKMYPLAFDTFVQYDSFLKIHIILELLKEDYRAFRDKLYQTLHPINQLVYKIINAQSK